MATVSTKSRLVATLLVIFLGVFGAHRFYVGKTGTAIFQLILTITVIGGVVSGIWALIDFVIIVTGSFTDKEGKVLSSWDPAATPVVTEDFSSLEKYLELRNKGVITEEEFQAKKKALLNL